MRIQKIFFLLGLIALLGLSVSCSDRYEEGFAKGKAQGYDEGYADGHVDGSEDGFQEAKAYFASPEYKEGYAAGEAAGYSNGRTVGYAQGDAQGYSRGINMGYDDGFDDGVQVNYGSGYSAGYTSGRIAGNNARGTLERQGYNAGYNDGYDDGENEGYDLGHSDGFYDGYDIGYDDGYYDGSFSVGKTKSLKGYANILSMAHNDMFDYSKIKSPKKTARGLVANGRLLFEETSLTAKDTLKMAAVAEQYLVTEMAKQVQDKFGLSAERSLKVAKAANHFRKYSTTRALTAEDTNAYSSEIIGVSLKSIESAFADSRQGDLNSMQNILQKAAEKNGTTPEKMGAIVAELFI